MLCLAVLLLTLGRPAAAWDLANPRVSVGPAPTWVAPLAPEVGTPAPVGPALEAAQYLLVDDEVRVGAAEVERYAHTTYRIVTREGLDGLSRLEVSFDPTWARVRVHHLRVWRDGAWQDRLDRAHATLIREEASLWQHIFDGTEKLVVVLPDVRVGDVVDVAWSVNGLDPVFGGRYGEGWAMAWGVATERRRLRLLWRPERPLQLASHGVAGPTLREDEGWREATWDLAHQVPVEEEDAQPEGFDPYPWVQASGFTGWAEVAAWAERVYALDIPAPPRVQALADQLWAQHPEPEGYALACLRWVQDEVRYFGIEMGDGSHVPSPPLTVLERRYGDCKDKSLLLVALLRARGLEAWPALVSRERRSSISEMLPSPLVFDHVVVVARVAGIERWMDPTERDQGGGLADAWIPSFGQALRVAPDTAALCAVPAPASPQGRATVRHVYDLRDDPGQPALAVQTVYEGRRAEEMRRSLADTNLSRLLGDYVGRYGEMGFAVRPVDALAIRDDRAVNTVEIAERYRIEATWEPMEDGRERFVLPDASIFDWLPRPGGARRQPLALPVGLDEREQITAQVDPEWDLPPVDGEVESPWFRFTAESIAGEGSLDVAYRLEVLRDQVEPADLAAYLAAVQEVEDLGGFAILRGERAFPVTWAMVEKVLGFLAAAFAVLVAVPASVVAAAVFIVLGLPRRRLRAP